ncbi:MAG: RHS repeat-associated core domain-containing protein [Bacteroidia bacterium]
MKYKMYLAYNHFYHSTNYLYGEPIKGSQGCRVSYRFHFNGKENDDETQTQDYGMRIYNPSLAKFLSVDPLTKAYPYLTPYQFASNCPISGIDMDGLEFYYAADGQYLGQGSDPKNMEVRLAKVNGTTKSGNNIVNAVDINGKTQKTWTVIHNDHDEFLQVAALAYNENTINPTAQQATANIVMNRKEQKSKSWGLTINSILDKFAGSGVGTSHKDRANDNKDQTYFHYANFFKESGSERNENSGMKSAISGTIKAFLSQDITGGGLFEKGTDFFDATKKADGTFKWKDYRDNFNHGFKWDTNNVSLLKGQYNNETYSSHLGSISGDYKYIGTASYGGNTYMKNNPKYKSK